ncbi:MAG TPA: metal ABC transporter substrate-binding protein, partial [Roseiflexaceae bacterium]|nr:metal ABC transporter substrate-binding protein [Roseiflexaceae bacterium]
ATTPEAGGTKLRAVTTMSVLADMISRVGGDRVQAENIIPVGAGPEDYQPTPEDAQKIARADVLFYNGFGLEEWLTDLFQSAGKPGLPQIEVARGLTPLGVGDEEFAEGNPHFWLSAENGARYVANIRDGLIQVDPAGKDVYTGNAERYIAELTALHTELKRQAESIPETERKIVTNHDAFPYFAQAYGFTVVGNVLGNPEAEPSAGEVAELVQKIKAEQVKAIFSEAQFSPRLTQTIADEAGITVISNLYTDSLGDNGSGITTYADMLRYNMRTIVEALK